MSAVSEATGAADAGSSTKMESPNPVTDYAFNIFGWRYDTGIMDRNLRMHTVAFKPSSGGFDRKGVKKAATLTLYPVKNPLPPDTALWLSVGVVLEFPDTYTSKKTGSTSNTKHPKKRRSAQENEIVAIHTDAHALPVVTEMKEMTQRRYYVLYNPDAAGLCQAKDISMEKVFIFSEFTDKSTNTKERKKNWTKLIVEAATGSIPSTVPILKRQVPEPFTERLPSNMELANDIVLLTSSLVRDPTKSWPLDRLLDAATKMDSQWDEQSALQNAAIRAFLDRESDLSEEIMDGFITACKVDSPLYISYVSVANILSTDFPSEYST